MIIAVILADTLQPLIQNQPPFLLPLKDETSVERVARVVLRGPFGGTVVAAHAKYQSDLKEALSGFAVQHVALPAAAIPGTVGALLPALKFAEDFRTRWERARAAAAARFKEDDSDEDEDDDADEPPSPKRKKNTPKQGAAEVRDWSRHSKNADVKVRGLARSFERDGIILFRAERPLIKPELQAQMVEAFARESADKKDKARPFAQAVYSGIRAYPVLFDRNVVPQIAKVAAATPFDDWLLDQLSRVQDVSVQDAGALESLNSEADYERIRTELK
jgi:CTP:molybdopterin cytidylyltransferase MocA